MSQGFLGGCQDSLGHSVGCWGLPLGVPQGFLGGVRTLQGALGDAEGAPGVPHGVLGGVSGGYREFRVVPWDPWVIPGVSCRDAQGILGVPSRPLAMLCIFEQNIYIYIYIYVYIYYISFCLIVDDVLQRCSKYAIEYMSFLQSKFCHLVCCSMTSHINMFHMRVNYDHVVLVCGDMSSTC